VKAAYADMSANLESLSAEKRRLEAQVAQMDADGRRNDRERRSLEQQSKDLGQQVARLIHEVQVLQSGLPAGAAGGGHGDGGAFAGGNASDVTTQRLVEFKDIEVRWCGAVR
jgi:hypothetical protein